MFIFKCGNCGKEFEVDEDRVGVGNFERYCSNCGNQVHYNLTKTAERILANEKTCEGWQIYRLPERYAKAQVTLTLPKE